MKRVKRVFGRDRLPDDRDLQYLIKAQASRRKVRHWKPGVVLDQHETPMCVGYASAGYLACSPIRQFPLAPDGIYALAQHADEWKGTCVDDETQALTQRGWLGRDDICIGDRLLAMDIETERLRWAGVVAVHRYTHANYRIWSHNQINIAVTDNHKWLVGNRNTESGVELVRTDELKSQHTIYRSCPGGGGFADVPIENDDFVECVAWCCTEGNYRPEWRRGNGIVVSQKTHKSRVASLMERLGVARGYDTANGSHAWELSGELAKRVRTVAPERAPTIEWLSRLTKRQLRLFIDACVLADGSEIEGKNGRLPRRVFHQKEGMILDAFLAACAMCGIPTSRASSGGGTNENVDTWSLRLSNVTEFRAMTAGPYINGNVWCPQTNAGTFVARRDGCVFITGNSYDGTSIRGAMKVLAITGHVSEYNWAFEVEPAISHVLEHGPLVMGTSWKGNMMTPDASGRVRATGRLLGGHAWLLTGIDLRTGLAHGLNSWGTQWGQMGTFTLSLEDLAVLIHEDGEACMAKESKPNVAAYM